MGINSCHWIKLAGFCGDEYFESEGNVVYIVRFSCFCIFWAISHEVTSKVRFRWYKLSKFNTVIFDSDLPLAIPAEHDGVIIGQSMKPTLELSFLKYGKFEIHIHVENNVTKLSKTVLLEIMKPVIVLKVIEDCIVSKFHKILQWKRIGGWGIVERIRVMAYRYDLHPYQQVIQWKHTVMDKTIFVSWPISFLTYLFSKLLRNFKQFIFILSTFLWTRYPQKYLTLRSTNLFLQHMWEIKILLLSLLL